MSEIDREENRPASVNSSTVDPLERKLVEAAQGGDNKAFGDLVRRHQKRLFRYVFGLTGSFDTAEDVVQEAFVKAYGALERFQRQYAFYPWLSTIARNLAYNHIAREEKKQSLDVLSEKGLDLESVDLGPLERLLDDENNKRFYRALTAMPVKYRSVFVLRTFEQMDYAAIASYLKIPPGTVDSRLHRARQFLLDKLKDLL